MFNIILDPSEAVKSSVMKETDHVPVKQASRPAICTLKNAINANIDGKLFCLAYVGQMKHREALKSCQDLNATLPLPRNRKEHFHFTESFKRLGIDKKIADFSTKIVLDVRRSSKKGKVSHFSASILETSIYL